MELKSSERLGGLICSTRNRGARENPRLQDEGVRGHFGAVHGSLEHDSVLNHLEVFMKCAL